MALHSHWQQVFSVYLLEFRLITIREILKSRYSGMKRQRITGKQWKRKNPSWQCVYFKLLNLNKGGGGTGSMLGTNTTHQSMVKMVIVVNKPEIFIAFLGNFGTRYFLKIFFNCCRWYRERRRTKEAQKNARDPRRCRRMSYCSVVS